MPPETRPSKILLFDLGGVIVRWVGIAAISKMVGIPIDEIHSRFAASQILSAFEKGFCSNAEFLTELDQVFAFGKESEELSKLWNSWVQEPYPQIEATLKKLKRQYRVACLSNTNDLHWNHLNSYFDCQQHFHHAYASHLIHLSKPDPACFKHVLQELNAAPDEVVFFDDTAVNIETASSLGLEVHLIDPKIGVVPTLQKLGYID